MSIIDNGDASTLFNLRFQSTNDLYFCVDNQCAGDLDFDDVGVWSHIVMTYDKVTIRLYVNGILEDKRKMSLGTIKTINDIPFIIGARVDDTG